MKSLILFLMLLALIGCNKDRHDSKLFRKIASDHSGLDFSNDIKENDILNILDYEYIYNGGGVGIGDFNSDGLQDVFFSGNMVSSRLYLNQGDFKFKDFTKEAGVETDVWCNGISIVDINNDGKPDIHLATAHDLGFNNAKNYFFVNKTDEKENVKFENLAKEMNLADDSYSVQAAFLDYDLDGDLDMFLANNSKEDYPKNNPFGQRNDGSGRSTDRLYRNDGINENGIPTFTNVSKEAGITLEGWSLGVVVFDIDKDGLPDIYLANDFMSNDILYLNNGDGTFTNRVEEYFKHQSHNSMGIDVADINNDAALDLLVLDMLPEDNLRKKTMFGEIPFERFNSSITAGYQSQFVRNVLQVNNGNGTFSDLGYYAGVAETDWSWSPMMADFDNDGLRDIYITNGYKKDITDMDFVDFNNSASKFSSEQKQRASLIEQMKKMKGVKKSNFFFKNLGENRFGNRTSEVGLQHPSYSNGAAYADFDQDGDLDLVINNIDDKALLFENTMVTKETDSSNYLRLLFEANVENMGVKTWVYVQDGKQYAEFQPQRGYMSSVEPALHFGLGQTDRVDSIRIVWPDKSTVLIKDIAADQAIEPDKKSSVRQIVPPAARQRPYFESTADPNKIDYVHRESTFDDFKKWPLRFRSYSRPGPILATGDINGDSLEDIFIGGTANNQGRSFLQNKDGGFNEQVLEDVLGTPMEDAAALLFDADGDGDLDLYCASGSTENHSRPELYQDRLYINDGKGEFALGINNLPKIDSPTNTVLPIDYDNDGDMDLFVGGRLDPNNYPFSPKSYLLENENGVFSDVTSTLAPKMQYAGMISDALLVDIDHDGWLDIVMVGEWTPIKVFYNRKGKFELDESANGLVDTNGWWNCIDGADFDGDGDIDFLVGNWGLNNPFTASREKPLRIYAKDFDENGNIEPIMTQYIQGKEHVVHPRGTLMKQLPLIRKLTGSYSSYGSKSFQELFGNFDFENKEIFRTHELASIYIENLGGGKFRYYPLPNKAQWSPIFDFELVDIDKDGGLDVLAVGNFYGAEVLTGHFDAGNGIGLLNDGRGKFTSLDPKRSGFEVPGEARNILRIKNAEAESLFIIGLQNDSLLMFRENNYEEGKQMLGEPKN